MSFSKLIRAQLNALQQNHDARFSQCQWRSTRSQNWLWFWRSELKKMASKCHWPKRRRRAKRRTEAFYQNIIRTRSRLLMPCHLAERKTVCSLHCECDCLSVCNSHVSVSGSGKFDRTRHVSHKDGQSESSENPTETKENRGFVKKRVPTRGQRLRRQKRLEKLMSPRASWGHVMMNDLSVSHHCCARFCRSLLTN